MPKGLVLQLFLQWRLLGTPLFTPRFFNLLKITPIRSLPPEIDVLQSFLPRCFQQGPGASRAAPGGTVQGGYLWSSSAPPQLFVWQLQGCLLPPVPLGLKLLAVFILWLHLPVAVGAAWLLDLPGSASLHLPAAWIRQEKFLLLLFFRLMRLPAAWSARAGSGEVQQICQ